MAADQCDSEGVRTEEVRLDLQPTENYRREVQIGHAKTRNLVVLILTWSIVLSLPVFLLARLVTRTGNEELDKVFDRWFSMVGPLAGAAVGAYGVSSRKT